MAIISHFPVFPGPSQRALARLAMFHSAYAPAKLATQIAYWFKVTIHNKLYDLDGIENLCSLASISIRSVDQYEEPQG